MDWADYRTGSKKAKLHLGFNINQGIPQKLFLTDGKSDERPFVHKLVEPGQTGVMDCGYQHHKNFDQLQTDEKHFVCRIKANTHKTCLEEYHLIARSRYGLMVQILAGLITYLLLAIYCHNESRFMKYLVEIKKQINESKYWHYSCNNML